MPFFRNILILLVFPLISAAPVHKFYVSITKIEYVKEENSLQIITKIFTDDVEDALQLMYDPSIVLDSKNESKKVDENIKRYILKNLVIKVNGKPLTLNYIGKEFDTDMLVAYFEVKDLKELKSIDIENKVLMEIFPEQQNIIHLKTPKTRRSLILDKDEPSGKLKFT
ncbi:hypothetical protein QRD02_09185 [Aequorivita sp. SDUM287046]|uniref:Peptidase E n=1 Tax=Aequorivita aurantiaca TaxID=3053356 RepID=A0ABT8DGQ5_9FLAO|nr:DUF6702 family protein [Aequorivita aurantiaca]MDN3724556.1 hypothetical protein [Aequorivita aurantiaca]